MGIPNIAAGMGAINMGYAGAGGIQGGNESRMALANNAGQAVSSGGELNPIQTASLAEQDKALALQGAAAQTNYQVAQAIGPAAKKARDKAAKAAVTSGG